MSGAAKIRKAPGRNYEGDDSPCSESNHGDPG
jgi:hypothetical protein